jgi:lysophospholipase L1-like esterase
MEQMIKLGKDSGADVFVLAGFDNSKTIDPNKVNTTIYVPSKEEMYKRWQRWMDWQKRLPQLIKSADKVIPVVEIPKEYVPDGLHPNVKGGRILADYIKKTL